MRKNRHSVQRQAQIYEVIRSFLMEKGYPPSVREIGSRVGLKSSSTVHGYLSQLAEEGKIRRDPTKPRAIDLVDHQAWKKTRNIPFVKKITADIQPNDDLGALDYYALPNDWVTVDTDLIIYQCADNKLASKGIGKGDYVLVKLQDTAKANDILLALVPDAAAASFYHYRKNAGKNMLVNDADEEIPLCGAKVFGKAISVYHRF